jgi:hypothetical protein
LPCLVNGRVFAAQAHELQHREGVIAGDGALDGRGGRRCSAVCERLRGGRLCRTQPHQRARWTHAACDTTQRTHSEDGLE